jgi:hypothetical protein
MTENASPQQNASMVAPTRRNTRAQREQIEHIILHNQEIADITIVREELLKQLAQMKTTPVPSPARLQIQNRKTHLRPFLPFFQRLLDPHSASPRMRSLARNVHMAAQCGWQAHDFRHIPSLFDHRFSDPDDLLEPIFSAIFQDREAGLLRQWMQVLDRHVEASSRRLLEAMDRNARDQQIPMRKDVVLVGGGPLTSIVASILGAFFHVTVITDQHGIGKPWRNRPIYINSSSFVNDFNDAPLPLLGGCTTRIIGRQQLNSLEIDLLLGTDTKLVRCENGKSVEYIAGPRMGDLIATNILLHADDYLIDQCVNLSALQRTTDGKIRLQLLDREDGTRRELDASAVFLLTGPGKEQSAIPPASSQPYGEEARLLETNLRQARSLLAWHREALHHLEGQEATPGVHVQRQWLCERIAQTNVDVPPVLTLTAIEKLYAFWDDFGALPDHFPLRDLLAPSTPIAYLGNGDTMRTLKELVEGRGPSSAYPSGFEPGKTKSTIYNEMAASPDAYDASNRRRYQGTYTSATTALPFKASRYRLLREKARVEVTHRDETGTRRRRQYRSAFDCTGLDRRPIEASLPASVACEDIRDLQGNVVARGNADANLFIAGSATGWTVRNFPEKAQNIVEAVGIPENTISLWINGPLVERLAYTYAATRPHTKW